jgi:hypothetical protein
VAPVSTSICARETRRSRRSGEDSPLSTIARSPAITSSRRPSAKSSCASARRKGRGSEPDVRILGDLGHAQELGAHLSRFAALDQLDDQQQVGARSRAAAARAIAASKSPAAIRSATRSTRAGTLSGRSASRLGGREYLLDRAAMEEDGRMHRAHACGLGIELARTVRVILDAGGIQQREGQLRKGEVRPGDVRPTSTSRLQMLIATWKSSVSRSRSAQAPSVGRCAGPPSARS